MKLTPHHHQRGRSCPAVVHTCKWCKRTGHFNRMCTQNPYGMNPKDPPKQSKYPTSSGSTQAQATDMQDDNWAPTNGSIDIMWTTNLLADGIAIPSVFFGMSFSNVFNTGNLDMAQVVIKVKAQPTVGATLCFLPDSGANITAIPMDEFVAFGGIPSYLRDNNPSPAAPQMANGSRHGWSVCGSFTALLHFPPSGCHEERKGILLHLDILTSKCLQGGNPKHHTNISSLDTTTQPLWSTLATCYSKALSGKCGVMDGGEVTIKLYPNAKPITTYSNRPIRINLKQAFENELQEQLVMGILEPAGDENNPSKWLNPMVVTWKKNAKKARITVDLRELSKATIRPTYYGAAPFTVVSSIPTSAQFFTVLDGLKGFHQIGLSPASRRLITFVTPMGRYRYRHMPMVTTDEFAGWPSLAHIHNMTSHTLINSFHTIFLATGVPNTLQQDNAPQFVSHQFRTFLAEWGRLLEPSSPLLSRSNGRAEAAVEAMKKLVLGALHDPDAISYGILAFRKTPRYGGQSPAELIFGQN
eukprot:TCALIF_07569-PA protein Name:"Similar to pol Retrovirus-related Pol polyprotein from transposon 297 (Drosophila melanogaster)" AED:0.15 eAED:0.19 QI:0/0/0/0.75/0.33/0/4/0/526